MGILSGKKTDLTTTEGLLSAAKGTPVEKQAITATKVGEDPKKIFSGGFIQDVFDILNAPQSVVVGALTPNLSMLDALSSRASFSDKNHLGKYGWQGVVGGILADIATDPLWLVPPLGLGRAIMKGFKGGADLFKATKMGGPVADWLGQRFVYRFAQPEMYKIMAEKSIINVSKGGEKAIKLARPITELLPAEQRLFQKVVIENGRKVVVRKTASELPPELLKKVAPAFDELERLGKLLVKYKVLSPITYKANIGRYIGNFYRKYEAPTVSKTVKGLFDKKPLRIDLDRTKARLTELPDDIREGMEPILEAGYPLAKSLAQMSQAVERAKFFGQVNKQFGSKTAQVGFKQLPKTAALGELSGKHVPESIFDDIQEIFKAKTYGQEIAGKIVRGFKFGKVIMNPATHARNMMSNMMLNNFAGIPLAKIPIYMARALTDMKKGGKFAKEIEEHGFQAGTFWGAEIKELLIHSGDPAIKRIPKKIMNALGDLYQKEELVGKRMQYIFQRERGLDPVQAWAKAEETLFNYAQVTPFIRKLRESIFGMPFITFTYKATPFVAKTLIQNPARIGKYGLIKKGVENLSPEKQLAEERANEPDYIKKGFFVRLPFRDQFGRSLYFDMTYILPFGDLISGNLFEGENQGEAYTTSMLRKFPALNIIGELYRNEDFFGNPIVKAKSDNGVTIGVDILSYMAKQYGPPPFVDTPQRLVTSAQLDKLTSAQRGSKRTITEEILRNFGLKVKPFVNEQEKARRDRETKNAIQQLLGEEGIVREFQIPFIPKK